MRADVRHATHNDIPGIVEVLGEASAWLRTRGIVQWPDQFPAQVLLASLAEQELYVVLRGDRMAGTVTLQWSDPMFWGDRNDAGFLHRLAILRQHAGAGRFVVSWAEDQVVAHGRRFLCLDTLSSNVRLRQYYEDLGFSAVGEMTGPVGHPHTAAHGAWKAALYEKLLTPRGAAR